MPRPNWGQVSCHRADKEAIRHAAEKAGLSDAAFLPVMLRAYEQRSADEQQLLRKLAEWRERAEGAEAYAALKVKEKHDLEQRIDQEVERGTLNYRDWMVAFLQMHADDLGRLIDELRAAVDAAIQLDEACAGAHLVRTEDMDEWLLSCMRRGWPGPFTPDASRLDVARRRALQRLPAEFEFAAGHILWLTELILGRNPQWGQGKWIYEPNKSPGAGPYEEDNGKHGTERRRKAKSNGHDPGESSVVPGPALQESP